MARKSTTTARKRGTASPARRAASKRTAAQKSAAARKAWKTRKANGWVHPKQVRLTKRQREMMAKAGLTASQASKL